MGELIKYELGQWERLKSLALDSVTSPHSKRAYESALDHFLAWYHSQSRPPICKAMVNAYKAQTAEQWIKEGKQAVKMTRLSCHRFRCNEVRLWLSVIAYNLGNLWRRLVPPARVGH